MGALTETFANTENHYYAMHSLMEPNFGSLRETGLPVAPYFCPCMDTINNISSQLQHLLSLAPINNILAHFKVIIPKGNIHSL